MRKGKITLMGVYLRVDRTPLVPKPEPPSDTSLDYMYIPSYSRPEKPSKRFVLRS